MTFQQQLQQWWAQWDELLYHLQSKGADAYNKHDEPATDGQIAEIEQSLGISLPEELRLLLKDSAEAWLGWTLPHTSLVPFDANGDWGWSLQTLEWLDLSEMDGDGEQTRYLSFYHAHNGDVLVLDMQVQPHRPAVLSWNHETGEFRFLAGSLTEFLERVTFLYGVGAESWQYEPFADYSGLNMQHPNTEQWRDWLDDYLNLTLDEAKHSLSRLIRYAEVSGEATAELRAAFDSFDRELVLEAWKQRIQQEPDRGVREALMEYTGDICGSYAADWVRSLWQTKAETHINSSILAYITARCLPEEEGLTLVLHELEQMEESGRLNGYTANSWLKPFASQKVIEWMFEGQRVSYPYDGWDHLFAASSPGATDVMKWLDGSGVQRQIVITALARFSDVPTVFKNANEVEQTKRLLERELEHAVTKKEKKLVEGALQALSEWQTS